MFFCLNYLYLTAYYRGGKFVPYRGSLLTRLLKDSLGGNGMSKYRTYKFLFLDQLISYLLFVFVAFLIVYQKIIKFYFRSLEALRTYPPRSLTLSLLITLPVNSYFSLPLTVAVMLACISPAGTQSAETKCTLEFASRAMQIENKACKNETETTEGKSYCLYVKVENNNDIGQLAIILFPCICICLCNTPTYFLCTSLSRSHTHAHKCSPFLLHTHLHFLSPSLGLLPFVCYSCGTSNPQGSDPPDRLQR